MKKKESSVEKKQSKSRKNDPNVDPKLIDEKKDLLKQVKPGRYVPTLKKLSGKEDRLR